MRIKQFLQDSQVPFETVLHAPAYTAQRRAKYLEMSGNRLGKAVVLALASEYVVAILPATRRVDLDAVGRALGRPSRLASHAEMADLFLDCEPGAKSPFGTLYGVRTIVDESLPPDAFIAFEAQRHSVAVLMRCRHFQELEKPLCFRFAS
jgi:Ala-tRNA(Pro) deacylase